MADDATGWNPEEFYVDDYNERFKNYCAVPRTRNRRPRATRSRTSRAATLGREQLAALLEPRHLPLVRRNRGRGSSLLRHARLFPLAADVRDDALRQAEGPVPLHAEHRRTAGPHPHRFRRRRLRRPVLRPPWHPAEGHPRRLHGAGFAGHEHGRRPLRGTEILEVDGVDVVYGGTQGRRRRDQRCAVAGRTRRDPRVRRTGPGAATSNAPSR